MAEATVKLSIGAETVMTVAEGNGPVNALDQALRKALTPHYPALQEMHLSDYKVRILTPSDATAALTRVVIESRDKDGHAWHTLGVSANLIDASNDALFDALTWYLMKQGLPSS
jgi:2-isopropylmalate synthase